MKKTKKYIIIFILLLCAAIFTGCTEFIIDASIDDTNTVYYSYEIVVHNIDEDDINYSQIKTYLSKMKGNWSRYDIDSEIITAQYSLTLRMRIEEQFETREAAFEALYGYMTNEISPFKDVEYTYNLNYYYEDYSLKANINLDDIVDEDVYEVYPDIVGKDVDEFLDTFKCTVNISLPMNESTETDIITENTKTFDIPVDGLTEVSISGLINNNTNKQYEIDLNAKRDKEEKNMIIFFSIGFVFIAGLVTLIILRKRKNKKVAAEQTPEQIAENAEKAAEAKKARKEKRAKKLKKEKKPKKPKEPSKDSQAPAEK